MEPQASHKYEQFSRNGLAPLSEAQKSTPHVITAFSEAFESAIPDLIESDSATEWDLHSMATQCTQTASTSLASLGKSTSTGKIDLGITNEVTSSTCSSIRSTPENSILLFFQPNSVYPPSYDDLPPGGCPRFPIIDQACGNEQLPEYSPSAFKFSIVFRKQEYVSPYDLSSNRSWKTVIIELNSTQFNVYEVSDDLEKELWKCHAREINESRPTREKHIIGNHCYSSITKKRDLDIFSLWKSYGLTEVMLVGDRRGATRKCSGDTSSIGPKRILSPEKHSQSQLIRSYSLQQARFGLANDYSKRPNVLRLRLENEQFLVQFSSAAELIEWHLGLSIGKGVALDIAERDCPKYRTVPRRRRNTIPTDFYAQHEGRRGRMRSQSDSCTKKARGQFLSSIFSSSFMSSSSKIQEPRSETSLFQFTQAISTPPKAQSRTSRFECHSAALVNEDTPSLVKKIYERGCLAMEYEDLNGRVTTGNSADFLRLNSSASPIGSLQQSDEEFEEAIGEDSDPDHPAFLSCETLDCGTTKVERTDSKWNPICKIETQKRFIRNCLKCIRPLVFDEKWLNKQMVKPIAITPLMSKYINTSPPPAEYASVERFHRGKSIVSKKSYLSRTSPEYNSVQSTGVTLNRKPNHYLQEFVVGSHALIPKSL